MKNVKYLVFVGLGCATLLLTGCGGSSNSGTSSGGSPTKNIITCKKNDDLVNETYEFEFNDKKDNLVSVKGYRSITIPDYVTEDEIEDTITEIEDEMCNDDRNKSCDVSRRGDKIELNVTFDNSLFGDLTEKEIVEMFEDNGYTCK